MEAGDLGPCEQLVGKVCEWRTAPEVERVAEQARRSRGPPGSQCVAPFRCQAPEPVEVELAWLDAEEVTRRLRQEHAVRRTRFTVGLEHTAKLRDVVLEGGCGRVRGRARPDLVDQPVARDNIVCVQEQQR